MRVAAALVLSTAGWARAAEPRPSSCIVAADKQAPVKPAPGRVLHCGLDLGSRSAKLSVVSMEEGQAPTIRDERICKRPLGMGALVFDSKTGTARPLPADAIAVLVDTINEFKGICARDGGAVVVAGATQWARDATNIADVRQRANAATGVHFDVLTAKQEAEYAYAAGSVTTPGRIVLDAGSNSFQLSWREKGSEAISSILVPHGYVRAAASEFDPAADYAGGRAAYQQRAKAHIEEELGRLRPALSLAHLRRLVGQGRIGPEIVALGEDGAIVPLAVRGLLRDGSLKWTADQATYDAALGGHRTAGGPFGTMTAAPVAAADVEGYLRAMDPADFRALRSEPLRSLYGHKALVAPALADLLLRELGATRLVAVPQEWATGHILTTLRGR